MGLLHRAAAALACLLVAGAAHAQAPLPTITLTPGEYYFRVDGTPAVTLGTNPAGWTQPQFDTLFAQAAVHEKIVRIHLTNIQPNPAAAGAVDEAWAVFWEGVFDAAAQNGLHVVPVFDAWAAWNNTHPVLQYWPSNPYNSANGGPAASPGELLVSGQTRDLWLAWLRTLVERWQGRPNILAWEFFSELNLISGATEATVVDFAGAAAAVIRAADMQGRPVTASLAGHLLDWTTLSGSAALDFIQIHPYPSSGDLDAEIIATVRSRLAAHGKPVFIGESGLDALLPVDKVNTLTLKPNAATGINQAIWAGAVSGAMSARMLWFEDGYDQYHTDANGNPLDLRTAYANASAPVAAFLAGVDVGGFAPIAATLSSELFGAALGDGDTIIGWVRDVATVAPDWNTRPLNGQTVTVAAPGQSHDWRVDIYDTATGAVLSTSYVNQAVNGDIVVALPGFDGSIAFQIHAVAPLVVAVDIRPQSAVNPINPDTPGGVPVAVLTTGDFDAATVDPGTVRFGPGQAMPMADRLFDVDQDGDLDLEMVIRKRDTGLLCGDTSASLTGTTTAGQPIAGADSVIVLGCPP